MANPAVFASPPPFAATPRARLSVIVPLFNEAGNVAPLLAELDAALASLDATAELVLVDDGSTDQTAAELTRATAGRAHCQVIRFTENRGQAAALLAGLQAAQGEIFLTLDGDGQDDPQEFRHLLPLVLAENCDLVCGIRTPRHDSLVRRAMSWLANTTRRLILRDGLHDAGCQLRVFRREIVAVLTPSPLLQAFLPAMAAAAGFRIAEHAVHHRPRRSGTSKYGLRQLWWRPMMEMFRLRRQLVRRGLRP